MKPKAEIFNCEYIHLETHITYRFPLLLCKICGFNISCYDVP